MPLGQTDYTAFTGKHAYRRTITCSQRCFNAGTPSTTLAQHLVSVAVLGLLLMTGALPSKHETLNQCCFNAGRRLENHMQPALFQCWYTVYDAGPTFGQRCRIRPTINDRCTSQQTRDVDPMLF